MQVSPSGLQLTYCTNIHPATGWPDVLANLQRIAPALKARVSPSAPFGLGLRLSAAEARELLEGDRLAALRAFLDDHGLYVALINGFPYGPFHGMAVKADVYRPDWRDPARLQYTLDLIRILQRLLPDGMDGGISTSPLSYKAWMPDAARRDWEAMTANVANVAIAAAIVEREHGARIHLDIEPEPDCVLETTDETVAFFERWLRPGGAPRVAAALGTTADAACDLLANHIAVCVDCCHAAVEFEHPVEAIDRLSEAGIRVGRIQLSSALRVDQPDAGSARDRLRPFADPTYLHQVIERTPGGLQHFADLDDALASVPSASPREWRVHFHVPLFAEAYDGLDSTQRVVGDVLRAVRDRPVTSHLEIETYTWDVLPAGLKTDIVDSIAREYGWVLQQIRA